MDLSIGRPDGAATVVAVSSDASPRVVCLHHLDEPFLGPAERPLRDAGLAID